MVFQTKMPNSILLLCLTCLLLSFVYSDGIQVVIVNNCKDSIWPAILGTAGQKTPNGGGFLLPAGQQAVVGASKYWSGRIWARQGCRFDTAGRGWCQTGDCNGRLACRGLGGQPPATIVEMTLGTAANPMHYYDVSLVDGFNLPVSMIPVGGRGSSGCGVAACEANLNVYCPNNLAVLSRGVVVGCKSACLATREDKYCCAGKYGSPGTCKPTIYGHFFKNICPRAYSYAYDEETGLRTCRANKYIITFCPPD